MKSPMCILLINCLLMSAVLSSVAATRQAPKDKMKITGESLVLAGVEPGKLTFADIVPGSIIVRSLYQTGKDAVVYEQGRDYVVNYAQGTIARAPASRMPDYSKNVLYGQKQFDHNKFAGFGNHAHFVWVDYQTRAGSPLTIPTDQAAALAKTRAKLTAGGPFKLIAFGDSISTGCEATTEDLRFQNRYAKTLMKRFPKAEISVEMGATGGDTTVNGLARLEEKVLTQKPDLVLVAFGMNDHNVPAFGVPLDKFEANLNQIVSTIRDRTGADVMLLSTFPPNPDWAFGSHQMEKYAEATKHVAQTQKCAYADVYSVWAKVLTRKDEPSLLGNNINHPNNFGHWLYLQALEAVQF